MSDSIEIFTDFVILIKANPNIHYKLYKLNSKCKETLFNVIKLEKRTNFLQF